MMIWRPGGPGGFPSSSPDRPAYPTGFAVERGASPRVAPIVADLVLRHLGFAGPCRAVHPIVRALRHDLEGSQASDLGLDMDLGDGHQGRQPMPSLPDGILHRLEVAP